jgi:hypothetical protein
MCIRDSHSSLTMNLEFEYCLKCLYIELNPFCIKDRFTWQMSASKPEVSPHCEGFSPEAIR